MTACLIIDAGGTYLKSAVLDTDGEVFENSFYSVRSHSDGSKERILRAFKKIIQNGLGFISGIGAIPGGIGIATPGPFDMEKATPLMKHKFQGIYGIDLRDYFYRISGLPKDTPIKFIHDANAVLLGELWRGNAKGVENAAVVTLGTGLGLAISQKGIVQCNDIGGPQVSIFRLPYKEGILEDYTAQKGILKIYKELARKSDITGIQVADIGKWAGEGDEVSRSTFRAIGKILSESLRSILEEYEIECLLFAGQISKSFDFMEAALKEGLGRVESLNKIDKVSSIEDAALWGALKNLCHS